MSMLAERKRKQRWCLNPRGNSWSSDEKKFGKRMLEKMGWKDGKGLGAHEDGAVEHIKVSCKNDSNGLGFKENGEQWTAHEDNFSSLLKSLDPNGASSTEKLEISGKSLEEKSQKSRARVHYHKFTRGKDLSRYSEKDLANIFGKKTLKPVEKAQEPEEQEVEKQTNEEKNFNVQTIERGSMVDYFKQKFPLFSMKSSYEIGSNGVLKSTKQESDSESEQKCGFGFDQSENANAKTSFVSYVKSSDEKASDGNETKKKKKRKIANVTDENDSKRMKLQEDDAGFVNPAFDPLSRNKIVGIKHSLTTISEENDETIEEEPVENPLAETPKQKKKNKKPTVEEDISFCFSNKSVEDVDSFGDEVVASSNENIATENPYEVKRKTKKNKQKSKEKREQEQVVETIDVAEEAIKPSKNSKKQKKSQLEEENSCFSNVIDDNLDSFVEETDISNPFEVKRKSKKIKQTSLASQEDLSYCNAALDDSKNIQNAEETSDNLNLNAFEVKRKIKKSKKKVSEATEYNNVTNATEKEVKKRKKGNADEGLGLDNPNLNISNESQKSQTELDTYNDFEVQNKVKSKRKRLKKNESHESGLDNPCLNLSAEENEFSAIESSVFESNLSLESEYVDLETESKSKGRRKKSKHNKIDCELNDSNLNSSQEAIEQETVKENVSIEKFKQIRTKTESIGLDNPNLTLNSSEEFGLNNVLNDSDFNTPKPALRLTVSTESSVKRKKSVRFSERNEERIIPNILQLEKGLDNGGFDLVTNVIDEGVENLNNALDNFQNELENDINEKKCQIQQVEEDQSKFRQKKPLESFQIEAPVEEDSKHGVIMKYAEGKLKKFTVKYRSDSTSAKKSYKHLVKGDVLVQFKGTNFHEIEGYALQCTPEKRKRSA